MNRERMKASLYSNFSTATDLADYLAKKGVPFRDSHEIIGRIVRHCEDRKVEFFRLDAAALRGFSEYFGDDAVSLLSPEDSTERKESAGSTSTGEIRKQIVMVTQRLASM